MPRACKAIRLRAYLGDKAAEQERMLAKLEADLGKDER
jgi:hypothetical protein